MRGIDRQNFIVACERLSDAIQRKKRVTEIIEDFGMARRQRQRLAILRNGLFKAPGILEREAEFDSASIEVALTFAAFVRKPMASMFRPRSKWINPNRCSASKSSPRYSSIAAHSLSALSKWPCWNELTACRCKRARFGIRAEALFH